MKALLLAAIVVLAGCRSLRPPPPSDSGLARPADERVEEDSASTEADAGPRAAESSETDPDSLRAVALAAAIVDSVRAAVRDSIEAARRDSIGAARRDSIGAARRDSIGAARRDSIGAARRDSIEAARRDSIEAARRDSARAAVVAAGDELEELRRLGPSYIPYDEGPETIWNTDVQATLTRMLLPVLREQALPARTRTVLWLLIRADGTVDDAIIQTGSGSDAFDAAALRFALQLRFVPAVREGRPVPVWVLRPISLLMQ